jgi:hypothetical protein
MTLGALYLFGSGLVNHDASWVIGGIVVAALGWFAFLAFAAVAHATDPEEDERKRQASVALRSD